MVTRGGHRVDHDKGIIYGVKILGRRSPNRHDQDEAERTEYAPSAMIEAIPLYEGAPVFKNHPPRDEPNRERTIEDASGWLESVDYEDRGDPEEDGLYGELHLLLSDPDTPKILESAERRPELFGLSHNARGRGDVVNKVYVIREILEVKSVDIVTDGATVKSLFESRRATMPATKKKKKPLDAKKEKALTEARRLLEAAGYTMEEDPSMADAGMGTEAGGDHLDDMFAAFKKLKETDPEKANELLKMLLKMMQVEEPAEDEEVEEGEEEDDDAGEETQESEECGADGKKKPSMTESRQPKKPAPGTVRLTEAKVRKLCGLAGVSEPAKELLESLRKLPDEDSVIDLLGQIKTRGQSPRSRARGTQVLESRQGDTNTPEGFRSALTDAG